MIDRLLVVWIALLLQCTAQTIHVETFLYKRIDDAARSLTARRWRRRRRRGGW